MRSKKRKAKNKKQKIKEQEAINKKPKSKEARGEKEQRRHD